MQQEGQTTAISLLPKDLQIISNSASIKSLSQEEGVKNLKSKIFNITFSKFESFTTKESFADFIDMYVDMYPLEKIEDIILFGKKCISGEYGKAYGKLSAIDIGEWFRKYLDWKYEQLEITKIQEKSHYHTHQSFFNIVDPVTGKTLAESLNDITHPVIKEESSNNMTHERYLDWLVENHKDMTSEELFNIYKQSFSYKNKDVMLLCINFGKDDIPLMELINEHNLSNGIKTEEVQDL